MNVNQQPNITVNPHPTLTPEQMKQLVSQLTPEKIKELTGQKAEDAVLESAANDRAAREPIPAVVNHAFDGFDEIEVGTESGVKLKIRKMKALDISIFKLTDSPFYKLTMGDIKAEDAANQQKMVTTLFPDEEVIFQLIYQFTHSAKDVYKKIKQSKEEYHNTVLMEVGEYSPSDVFSLLKSIMNHIGLVNSAKVNFESPEPNESAGEDGKKKLISATPTSSPNLEAGPAGSVGMPITSAVS